MNKTKCHYGELKEALAPLADNPRAAVTLPAKCSTTGAYGTALEMGMHITVWEFFGVKFAWRRK